MALIDSTTTGGVNLGGVNITSKMYARLLAFIATQKAGTLKPDNEIDVVEAALDAYLP